MNLCLSKILLLASYLVNWNIDQACYTFFVC